MNEGITPSSFINQMFPFQKKITEWALKCGRACIFADCGMGKTLMELAWAKEVSRYGKVLIVAPLAVAQQTTREGDKFGIPCVYSRKLCDSDITVTNYEMLSKFNPDDYIGFIIDESSILKSFDGKYRNMLMDFSSNIKYRLACSATPAPNDYMELGNHSEFVGALSRTEMLSKYFVHDGGRTSNWRLKGHAEVEFWRWVSTWAVAITHPSEIGDDTPGYTLPDLTTHMEYIDLPDDIHESQGTLFPVPVKTLNEQRAVRRGTLNERVEKIKHIVSLHPDEPFIIWCELNDEADAIMKAIPGSVQVAGKDSIETKESRLIGFSMQDYNILISKPSIAGHGMNWQHCSKMIFAGASHSYEQFYQTVRRCWRFGQTKNVHVYIVISALDESIIQNMQRKEQEAETMKKAMSKTVMEYFLQSREIDHPETQKSESNKWIMFHGDCVETTKKIESDSIHYSIFSPPFSSLYTYSDSPYDMGNCENDDEFIGHFKFLVHELYRVLMPGRLVSFHCMNLPTSKSRDGFIGIRDFRGELIRLFESEGFIYHSEVCIWKDPVTAMQRTKALGLLHKQIKKDSAMSRQGIPDYLVTMRKPGDNPEPVTHTNEDFPVSLWQRYASPIWSDINPSDTLQFRSAREHKDERHICPLQLEVIRRALKIWSNPGDVVLSPFAGIGSEGYVSIEEGRQFIGVELKESYYNQAVGNLKNAETISNRLSLFGDIDTHEEVASQAEAVS